MTASTTTITSLDVSTTGTKQRDVADKIRTLFPENAKFMALVSQGPVEATGVNRGKSLIGKRRVTSHKYECFTYSPLAVTFTVSVYNSGTSLSVSSADGLHTKMCLYNTANQTFCRIGAIATLALTLTSVGGTTFSASVGDVLLACAPVYPENSSSPSMIVNDETNIYNHTFIARIPLYMSGTAMAEKHYGGDYFARKREMAFKEGMRRVENSMIFGDRPSSTNSYTTDGTLADNFRTTRGMLKWYGNYYDAGGVMTHEEFVGDLSQQINECIPSSKTLIMFCGNRIKADMLSWANSKLQVIQSDTFKEYGLDTNRFVTSRCPIEVMEHDAFNRGSLQNEAVIFDPESLEYCFLADRDLKIYDKRQNNDVDGRMDEIMGEIGFGTNDGGKSILWVQNWLAL